MGVVIEMCINIKYPSPPPWMAVADLPTKNHSASSPVRVFSHRAVYFLPGYGSLALGAL
jgi:hypothetical protein